MTITEFTGKAGFLALEYPCLIVYEGIEFPNAATLFYALKTTDKGMMRKIARLSPNKARQKVSAWKNEEYDSNRREYLYQACKLKFDSNPELKKQLIDTNDAKLVNTVAHRDDWIGVRANGTGKNALGVVLMKLREEYISSKGTPRFSITTD